MLLICLRPEAVQTFDVVLTRQRRIIPRRLHVVDGIHAHHLRAEDFVIPPRDLKITWRGSATLSAALVSRPAVSNCR